MVAKVSRVLDNVCSPHCGIMFIPFFFSMKVKNFADQKSYWLIHVTRFDDSLPKYMVAKRKYY